MLVQRECQCFDGIWQQFAYDNLRKLTIRCYGRLSRCVATRNVPTRIMGKQMTATKAVPLAFNDQLEAMLEHDFSEVSHPKKLANTPDRKRGLGQFSRLPKASFWIKRVFLITT